MNEEIITVKPHQVKDIQEDLTFGIVEGPLFLRHGTEVVSRRRNIIGRIQADPTTPIRISPKGKSVCGEDCQQKKLFRCDSRHALEEEKAIAKRLKLSLDQKPKPAREIFEIPGDQK